MNTHYIKTPFDERTIKQLRSGDRVYITGVIYTARDAAHKRIVDAMNKGTKLPFDLKDQVIYYSGPTPARPGYVIGSIGPTTSGRVDAYAPKLLAAGLKGMVGKGHRSQAVKTAIINHQAVYLAAVGGTAALISLSIKKAEVIAYPDLGTEAIYRLEVENFPAMVVNDIYGGDLYEQGKAAYAVKRVPKK
jgi:fumarate hydratase subunit beta